MTRTKRPLTLLRSAVSNKSPLFLGLCLLAAVFAGCSKKPDAKGLATYLNDRIDEKEIMSKGRLSLPVNIENLNLESSLNESEARIRFTGHATLEESFYTPTAIPNSLAASFAQADRQLNDLKNAGSSLEGIFQSEFFSKSDAFQTKPPRFYEAVASKGERIELKGKATAALFGDAWDYEIEEKELQLLIAQIENELKGAISESKLSPGAFAIGRDDETEIQKGIDDQIAMVTRHLDTLKAKQQMALDAAKESVIDRFQPGAVLTGEYPIGRDEITIYLEIQNLDTNSLRGDVLIRNRNSWTITRPGNLEFSVRSDGGATATVNSPRENAQPEAGPLISQTDDLEMSLGMKDSLLIGTVGRRQYRLEPLRPEDIQETKDRIAANALQIEQEQAAAEERKQDFLDRFNEGNEYIGEITSNRGANFEVTMTIDFYDEETGVIKTSIQETKGDKAIRSFSGLIEENEEFAANPTLTLNSTRDQAPAKGNSNFLNNRSSLWIKFETSEFGLLGAHNGWQVALRPLTAEIKANRAAVEDARRKELLALTEPGARYFGTMSSTRNAVSGDLIFHMTDRSSDGTSVSITVIDVSTGATRVYQGQVDYDDPPQNGSPLSIIVKPGPSGYGNSGKSQFNFIGIRNASRHAFSFVNHGTESIEVTAPTNYWKGEFRRMSDDETERESSRPSSFTASAPPQTEPIPSSAPNPNPPTSNTLATATPASDAQTPPPLAQFTLPAKTGAYYLQENEWKPLPFMTVDRINRTRAFPGIDGVGPWVELAPQGSPIALPPNPEILIIAPGYEVSLVQLKKNGKGNNYFGLNRLLESDGFRKSWTVSESNAIFVERYTVNSGTFVIRPPSPLSLGDFVLYFEEGSLEKNELGFEFSVTSKELQQESIQTLFPREPSEREPTIYASGEVSSPNLAGSEWFATIAKTNPAMEIDPLVEAFWTKGAYFYLREDGLLGLNGDVRGSYQYNHVQRWDFDGGILTISLGEFVYPIDYNTHDNSLDGYFNGIFRMTIRRL
ncbi:MAG: hypothetical protein AAGB46_08580 [Verrucomicrobiota bacterium]